MALGHLLQRYPCAAAGVVAFGRLRFRAARQGPTARKPLCQQVPRDVRGLASTESEDCRREAGRLTGARAGLVGPPRGRWLWAAELLVERSHGGPQAARFAPRLSLPANAW